MQPFRCFLSPQNIQSIYFLKDKEVCRKFCCVFWLQNNWWSVALKIRILDNCMPWQGHKVEMQFVRDSDSFMSDSYRFAKSGSILFPDFVCVLQLNEKLEFIEPPAFIAQVLTYLFTHCLICKLFVAPRSFFGGKWYGHDAQNQIFMVREKKCVRAWDVLILLIVNINL